MYVLHEQWALDQHFWCLFCLCLRGSVILPTCSVYPQQKRDYSALHPQAWTCIYTGHACRHLPSAVPWISEDHLLMIRMHTDIVSFFSSIRSVKLTAVFSQWVLVQLNSNMFVTYWYMEVSWALWLWGTWLSFKGANWCSLCPRKSSVVTWSVSMQNVPTL